MVGEKNKNVFDELIVVKRSGQRVEFNSTKIVVAIKKAFDQVRPINSEKEINKIYEDVLNYISNNYTDRRTINVEDIQDIIETKLKENKCLDVYEVFSDYRIRRASSRKVFVIKQQHKFVKAIERIGDFEKENNTPNEILLDFGKTISCEYTKSFVLDNKFVRAHEEGNIYIHNLDYFNLGKISSTHLIFDKDLDDSFPSDLIVEALQAKDEIDGEICIDALDYLLIPFIQRKFKEKIKSNLYTYLSICGCLEYINLRKIEEIIDKQNTIYFNNELFDNFILNKKIEEIFTLAYQDSLSYISELLLNAISTLLKRLNDNYQENKKYSVSIGSNNTLDGELVSNIYLKTIETFDKLDNICTIFKVNNNTNKELLNKVSLLIVDGKNIAISFTDTSYNHDNNNCVEYFSNGKRIFENDVYEEKGSKGRMIVGSVSINMGRLGFKYANKQINDFYIELDEWLDMAKNCLVNIFETMGNKNKNNYKILFNGNIIDDEKLEVGQKIRKILKKGVLNLELAGLAECVISLEQDEEKQKELLINIIQYVKDKCQFYTSETKMNFVVSETSKNRPLKKLMGLDKSIYGIKKNVTDKEKYQRIDSLFNFKENIFEDLKYIGKYQKLLTGGNLVEINLSKSIKSKDILNLIDVSLKNDVGFIKFSFKR